MNFFQDRKNPSLAWSSCRTYRIESTTGEHGTWMNAYHHATGKHVGGSYDRAQVKLEIAQHVAKQASAA